MTELWATIPQAPNYEVSSIGRIRRSTPGPHTFAGRIVKTHITRSRNGRKRRVVRLPFSGPTKKKSFKVSALILEAFIGRRPNRRYMASHLNDVELDDRLENLSWETHQTNVKRRLYNSLRKKNEEVGT